MEIYNIKKRWCSNYRLLKYAILSMSIALLMSSIAIAQVQTYRISASKTAVLNQYNPNDFYNPPDLYAGAFNTQNGVKKARSLLLFELKDVDGHVLNAYLKIEVRLTDPLSTRQPYEISVHKATSSWQKPTWNNAPTYANYPLFSVIIAEDGSYPLTNLKDTVQEWLRNPSSNYGILLKGLDESPLNLKQIRSITLIIETEKENECNKNNGICRNSCGNDENEADYRCGFGERCCVKYAKEPRADFNGDGKIDGVVDFKLFAAAYQAKKSSADLNNDGKFDFRDMNIFTENIGKKVRIPTTDFNTDGCVDYSDYLEFKEALGSSQQEYDLNSDGRVDSKDYNIFRQDYHKGCIEVMQSMIIK